MAQQPPVIPNYETPVLEPNLDPASPDPFGGRFNTAYYQFLNKILATIQPLSELALTGAAEAGAIALDGPKAIITTEALTTAAGATYTLTLTNPQIDDTSLVMVTVSNGTNSAGTAVLESLAVGSGEATIRIKNIGAAAFNGTLVIQFLVE